MSFLAEFVMKHAVRGACTCGKCIDAGTEPEKNQPKGHTSDLIFFEVAAQGDPSKDEFIKLVREHKGYYGNVDLFDGKDHNYMELGAWIGDQGLALMCMGLGEILGVWKLMTPMSVLKLRKENPLVQTMAGQGFLSVIVQPDVQTVAAGAGV